MLIGLRRNRLRQRQAIRCVFLGATTSRRDNILTVRARMRVFRNYVCYVGV